MNKALAIFFAIAAIVLGLFLAVFALRVEMLHTKTNFLMKLARLENASIEDYKAEFGEPMYSVRQGDDWSPDPDRFVDSKLTEGQTAYFFSAQTIPTRFLVVVCHADGSVAWRTWVPM